MSREKQIDEMKQDINTALARDCSKARCLTCEFINEENCEPSIIAEHLYNEGYRKQSEWISVDERLPEREGYYLTSTIRGVIMIGPFFSYYASNDKPQFKYDVTHWMPLPEAPKMKGGVE